MEAELSAGRVYLIDVTDREGIRKLRPVQPANKYVVDEIMEFLSSAPAEEIESYEILQVQKRQRKRVNKALVRYSEDKQKGFRPAELTKDMHIP